MKILLTTLVFLATAATACAHFVYVVPTDDGKRVHVYLSETLSPDSDVDAGELVDRTRLFAVDAAGGRSLLKCSVHDNSLESGPLPAATALVAGVTRYGVI